eukprot:605781-Prymnesium_polylepis.1
MSNFPHDPLVGNPTETFPMILQRDNRLLAVLFGLTSAIGKASALQTPPAPPPSLPPPPVIAVTG